MFFLSSFFSFSHFIFQSFFYSLFPTLSQKWYVSDKEYKLQFYFITFFSYFFITLIILCKFTKRSRNRCFQGFTNLELLVIVEDRQQ